MAKRFTDTDKWKKPFIRSLKAPYKLLWFYILDECDHAGIWQVDFEIAQIKIGERLNEKTAVEFLGEKIFVFADAQKWFIPAFVTFQYGPLKASNRAHESVINILKRYNLINENNDLISPLQGAKDMDKDKDMVKDKDKDKEPPKKEKTVFDGVFEKFLEMRKTIRKPATHHAQDLIKKELEKLAPQNEPLQVEILNQSILNSWQDIYPLKNKTTATPQEPLRKPYDPNDPKNQW